MNIVLMLIGVVVVYKILSVVYKENWDKNLSSDVSFSNKTATKGDKIDIIECKEASSVLYECKV